MKIKKRAKVQKFRASSGNVCRFKMLGSTKRAGGATVDVIDAEWGDTPSSQDIAEANEHYQALNPETAMVSCQIEDTYRRAAVVNEVLYGGSQN